MNSDTPLSQIISSFEDHLKDKNNADQTLDQFFESLSDIEQDNASNSAVISHVKMMRSIGSYLRKNREMAHPDTLPNLTIISDNTQKLMGPTELDNSQIRTIFNQSHSLFKVLKKKITSPTLFTEDDMTQLSSVILAIDWEITDETILSYEQVVVGLLSKTKPNTIFHSFLKIMQSIGAYIKKQKSNAIADSVSFLKSIFENFERLVLSQDMDLNEKKRLLESDLEQFKKLKQKIAAQKPLPASSETSDEDFQPALSHVKSDTSSEQSSGFELTELPEVQNDPSSGEQDQFDNIEPALSGKQPDSSQGANIMDDLFNAKESPADELLDAIHLMDVHGKNEDHALKMLDRNEENQAAGIQSFTPHRMGTDPIPEIGDRLNEFFSIEEPSDPIEPVQPNEPEEVASIEVYPVDEQVSPSGPADTPSSEPEIVPFEYEDDGTYEQNPIEDGTDSIEQDIDEQPIKVLQSFLSKPGWEKDRWSLQSIQKECYNLKDGRPDAREINALLDIILELSRSLEDVSQQLESNQDQSLPDTVKKKGFFAKIKGMFSS